MDKSTTGISSLICSSFVVDAIGAQTVFCWRSQASAMDETDVFLSLAI
jgi:hypothetical protein